jgi:Transposase DDE domain
MDGSTLDVPDEDANRIEFGGPTTFNEHSPFPQIRFATLTEIGTRVLFGAQMGSYSTSEVELARQVVSALKPGMLCLADRGFYGFDMLERVRETGAQFLFRARKDNVLPIAQVLPDGSFLSEINTWRRASVGERRPPVMVRVIQYRLDGVEEKDNIYTLVTSLLDPQEAPAADLAKLYQQRWEIETAFDELKTHLRGERLCLRSKTPELVRQEFYGLMLAHYTVRALIHEAALKVKADPDRISFTHSVNVVRRKLGHLVPLPPSAPG